MHVCNLILFIGGVYNRVWEYLCVQPYIIYRESIIMCVGVSVCATLYYLYGESIIVCGSICVCNLILFIGSL